MTREFLKNLGLEDVAIDKILDENMRDIGKEKGNTTTAQNELSAAQGKLKTALADLETLKKSNGDVATVQQKLEDLIDGANVVPERMIFQLLFPIDGNVGIAIRANGMDYTYNYDRDGTWKAQNYIALTGGDLWTAPTTADPFKAFKAAKDGVRSRTGTELTTAIMNTATFNLLAATNAVKNRYLTTNGLSLGYLTDDEVKAVVNGTSRIQIAIYDKMFKDESGVAHAFIPDGYVCMVPTGSLGNTWYGTTPEEADLMSDSQAEVSIVNTGVAITRIIDTHPVNINTFASEIVLPSYERMDEVVLLKVA